MNIFEKNYYKILNISPNSNISEILESYDKLIETYSSLPFLTSSQKIYVKNLNISKYILSNKTLRKKYDDHIQKKHTDTSTSICDRIFDI